MNRNYSLIKYKRSISYLLSIILLISLFLISMIYTDSIKGLGYINSSVVNLTLKDQTESGVWQSGNRFTFGTIQSKTINNWNVHVFSNFTNVSSGVSLTDGNCTVRFQENQTSTYTAFVNMTYNVSFDAYFYNRSFSYKGNITYQVHCEYALNS